MRKKPAVSDAIRMLTDVRIANKTTSSLHTYRVRKEIERDLPQD